MQIPGTIKGNIIELDKPAGLPSGQRVIVRISPDSESTPSIKLPKLLQSIEDECGLINGPEDFSEHHDNYIYGIPGDNR